MLLVTLWMSIKISGGTLVEGRCRDSNFFERESLTRRWMMECARSSCGSLLRAPALERNPQDLERAPEEDSYEIAGDCSYLVSPRLISSHLFKISSANLYSHPIDIFPHPFHASRSIETSYITFRTRVSSALNKDCLGENFL